MKKFSYNRITHVQAQDVVGISEREGDGNWELVGITPSPGHHDSHICIVDLFFKRENCTVPVREMI